MPTFGDGAGGELQALVGERPAAESYPWLPSWITMGIEDGAKRRKPEEDPEQGLVRTLGLVQLIAIGIGASIGAGIFVLTGTAANAAGPAAAVSFGLAALVAALDATCYAELASRFPVVGSAFMYVSVAWQATTSEDG